MDIYFKILKSDYGIVQVEDVNSILPFINESEFITFSKTTDELSVVCEAKYISDYLNTDLRWKGIYIAKALDFSLVGIISQISELLARNNISVYTVSTFNTDYFFVKNDSFEKTIELIKSQKNYYFSD